MKIKTERAIFAGGCFWCTQAVFNEISGIKKTTAGYIGGKMENPSYEQVSSGKTGHAEAVEIEFDPDIVSYQTLLEVFFKTHDPTTLNRQGNDIGSQYRSAIFYENDYQKELSEKYISEQNRGKFNNKIVTELTLYSVFYPAEEYHQNYFAKNPNSAYCRLVIKPKLEKLKNINQKSEAMVIIE